MSFMKFFATLFGFYLLSFTVVAADGEQSLATFEGLDIRGQAPPAPFHKPIPSGYAGLHWQNFSVTAGTQFDSRYGYKTGIVSGTNVAFNAFGDPGTILARGVFDLHSAYLTSGVISNMLVRVVGSRDQVIEYDNTYEVSTEGPVFINFDYLDVDEVRFICIPPPPWGPHPVVIDDLLATVTLDSDNDGVPDDKDQCPNTASGDLVNRNGCSIDQLVACSGPGRGGRWRSHGEYVAAVVKVAESFRIAGLITSR